MEAQNPFEVVSLMIHEAIRIDHRPDYDEIYIKVTNKAALVFYSLVSGVIKLALIEELKRDSEHQLENILRLMGENPGTWPSIIKTLVNMSFELIGTYPLSDEEQLYQDLLCFSESYSAAHSAIYNV